MFETVNAGHVGSSLSCAEILTVAKFCWMKNDDKLVLSKGHAAACLYSILAEAGKISEEQINSFYQNNTILPAHPPVNKFEEIPFATGSLGHGLPIASGFGLSNKLLKKVDRKFHHKLIVPFQFYDENNFKEYNFIILFKEKERTSENLLKVPVDAVLSTSIHDLNEWEKLPDKFKIVFYSPVFESISKLNYKPKISLEKLTSNTKHQTIKN